MEIQGFVSFPDKSEMIAAALGVLPFICNLSFTASSTVNGRVTSYQSADTADIVMGALCIVATLFNLRLWGQTREEDRLKRGGVYVALLALGVYQVVSGLGLLTRVG